MASTATASSGLEKQGTGENTNAWGVRLNTSLDLIDEMVNGVAGNAVTTSFGLTITNYASSDGRKMVQRLTGTPVAGFTITLPARYLVRVFHNLTGQTATITNGAGATCEVRTGTMAIVYSDTANGCFVDDETLDKVKLAAASVDLNSQKIINLLPPTNGTDAANKNYVDTFTAARSAGGFKLTNLANGTVSTDAVNYGQLTGAVFSAGAILPGTAAGQAVIWDGSAYVPGALDLADSDAKTGLLPIANGGTGAGTAAGARSAVLGNAASNTGKAIVSDGSDWLPASVPTNIPLSSKSSNYTVLATDAGKLIECTATLTLSLTAAATLGSGFTFFVRVSTLDTAVTIDPNGAELIDGRSTVTGYVGDNVFSVVCDGSAFRTSRVRGEAIVMGQTTVGSSVSSVDREFGFTDAELEAISFTVKGLRAVASGAMIMRVRKSGSYAASSYNGVAVNSSNGTLTGQTSSGLNGVPLAVTVGVSGSVSGSAKITGHLESAYQRHCISATSITDAGQTNLGTGSQTTAAAVTGIRFLSSGGNVDQGIITQYGVRA